MLKPSREFQDAAANPGQSQTWSAAAANAASTKPSAASVLRKIKALILLSGAVHQSDFAAATGRSVLELPVSEDQSVLDLWRGHALRLSRLVEQEAIPVRILAGHAATAPQLASGDAEMKLSIERDPYELRGTGGVLRDISSAYDGDDYLLVATAAQVLLEPLSEMTSAMAATGGDTCLLGHENGAPSNLMLVKCRCLQTIPDVGFVDMKEQGLPMIAARHHVTVLQREGTTGLPIRTLEDYTLALHVYHRRMKSETLTDDPFAERWFSNAAVIEENATVDPTARLHDSVVLSGGHVAAGAVVVRSLVCPGAKVRKGQLVVRSIVTPGG